MTRTTYVLDAYSCARASKWTIKPVSSHKALIVQGFRFGKIIEVWKAVDTQPVQHLSVLDNWEKVILNNFADDRYKLTPHSNVFRERNAHFNVQRGSWRRTLT